MDQAIHDYLIKLLTVMGGKMDHMPRVRNPPKKGEPKIKCDCNENPIDLMTMKVSDRRELIHEGWQLIEKAKADNAGHGQVGSRDTSEAGSIPDDRWEADPWRLPPR